MPRSAQLIVNNSAQTIPVVAPWVFLANAMIQGGGSFAYDAGGSFAVQNLGAYHFVQDVAVPPADYAAVDAGQRALDYDAFGAMISLASTLTMYLEARDVGGTVLQRWQQSVLVAGKPYTQFTVRMQKIPPNTRTVRVGFQGNNGFGNSGWFDALTLYFDDFALALTKGASYVASGPPSGVLLNQKALGYLVEGMGFRDEIMTSKMVLYAVSAASHTLALLKGVVYVVTGTPGGFQGVIMACQDRPTANSFEACATRPTSFASECQERPTDIWFKNDQPIKRV